MNKIIKLIDGGELECYEIESTTQQENIDNSLQLDTTGVYLQIGNRKRRNKTPKTKIQDRPEVRLFVEHAHFFFEHSEEIRLDSRMFLSPIPFNNGLAYTGESGFQHPTLGVYIEWWLSNQEVRLLDEKGNKWLVWYLAGSPLTHANSCGLVRDDGMMISKNIPDFMKVVKNFWVINRRYDEVKQGYKFFSLSEVINEIIRKDIRPRKDGK
jgi:hypothetical protein